MHVLKPQVLMLSLGSMWRNLRDAVTLVRRKEGSCYLRGAVGASCTP